MDTTSSWSPPINEQTQIPKTGKASASIKLAERLMDLGDQLKGIVATCEQRDQLVSYVLELVSVRTSALGTLWLEQPRADELQICESRFSNPTLDSKHIRRVVQDAAQLALADGTPKLIETEQIRGSAVIATPVFIDDKTMGIFAILLHQPRENARELLLVAQLVSANLDLWRGREHLNRMNFELHSAAALLELLNKLDECDTTQQASLAVVNQLQQLIKCERVAIGLFRSGQRTCRLKAISGRPDFDRYSDSTQAYEAAFDEAVMKNSVCSYPPLEQQGVVAPAQKKLAEQLNCQAAVALPLFQDDEQTMGAICFLGETATLHNSLCRNLFVAMQSPIGTSLSAVKRVEGGPLRRTIRRIREGKELKSIWLVAGAIALTLGAMFIPVDYRIGCHCTAQPVERRISVAPYDGLLENTFVEPGDVVEKGIQLAQMDGREIRIQLASVENDRQAAAKKSDAHRARHEVSDMIIADLEQRRLANEAQMLLQRQEQLRISSPVDGIVLKGNIDRRQNFPVNVGQELFEIAPLSPLKVEVEIPSDEVIHVQPGDSVQIRFDGFGLGVVEGSIQKIRPRSEIRSDENVFVAEVILQNSDQTIRPGMEGSARITAMKKSLGWCLFHRPLEKLGHALGF